VPKARRNSSERSCQTEAEVKAVFLDYDGTVAPLEVPRSESAVSPRNAQVLHKISQRIPVAIVTTKDLPFVMERTPFAHAWSGLGGLETKVHGAVIRAPCLGNPASYVMTALRHVKSVCADGLVVEEKRDSEGVVVAFSVDWRQALNSREAEEMALDIIAYCRTLPLFTVRNDGQPFFDVFPCPIDKGEAVTRLKRKLGLHDGVLYMGDSSVDNSAFRAADVAVGVVHEETPDDLACDCLVRFEDVASFLECLVGNGLRFSLDFPMIQRETSTLRRRRRRKAAGKGT